MLSPRKPLMVAVAYRATPGRTPQWELLWDDGACAAWDDGDLIGWD
jgi:hypothetical protein